MTDLYVVLIFQGKGQFCPDISSILDSKLDAKLEALRTQVNHDGRQNMISLLAELQNFHEGGAGRNLACCISHVLQVALAYGEEVAAEGPRTPVKKPSASAAGIRSTPDTFDRALRTIANGRYVWVWFVLAVRTRGMHSCL